MTARNLWRQRYKIRVSSFCSVFLPRRGDEKKKKRWKKERKDTPNWIMGLDVYVNGSVYSFTFSFFDMYNEKHLPQINKKELSCFVFVLYFHVLFYLTDALLIFFIHTILYYFILYTILCTVFLFFWSYKNFCLNALKV